MRRSAPGSETRRTAGFTLVELLIVVALIAVASGIVSLALRDPAATRLEREAARLSALLEAARAESRASGVAARWEPRREQAELPGFRFLGLPASIELPEQWLGEGVRAEIPGARALLLGPEPLIPPQRVLLHLDRQYLLLGTDGLGPFTVLETGSEGAP